MIFRRSLLREFAQLAAAVFPTLFLIALTARLVRLLGQAAGGKIPSDAVVAFLGFFAINILPVLLTLTLFIAILLALSRMWRDSEMVIWFNSGLSLAAWLRPVLWFAAPLVFVIALLTLLVTPWSAGMAEQYRSRIESRDDVSRVDPGAFGESRARERVFFVEAVTGDQASWQNVFVNSLQRNRNGVMVAERGRTEVAPNGDRFVVLLNGRRYEGIPGDAEYEVTEFERYAMRIGTPEPASAEATQKGMPTLALIEAPTPANRGELLWRIGLPLAALVLALLAIPLSYVNPRAGRSINLVTALLVYITYSNLLSVSQAQVAQGKLAFGVGWWLVHAVMIVALILMFGRRLTLAVPFRK